MPNTLLDGIMKYRTSSGGFTHSYVNDEDNPTAVAGMPNTMASEQTLYGLTALVRFLEGKGDFTTSARSRAKSCAF